MSESIFPIKKVFEIIDACINLNQLKTCESIADVYTKMVKSKGVVNTSLIKDTLMIHINERRQEILMANSFKSCVN